MGVMNRLNGLFTSLAFYIAATVFGFENGDNPGPNPDLASRFLLIIFPGAAVLMAAIISLFLHFKDENNKEQKNEQE